MYKAPDTTVGTGLFQIAAPIPESALIVLLIIGELKLVIIGVGELGKSEQPGGSGFAGIIDAGDSKPIVAVIFYQ